MTPRKKAPKKTQANKSEGERRGASPYLYYGLLLLVVLLFALVRFRLREIPLERDEGEYAYAGQLMLQGIPPYELAYNMKLPGTYAAYAGVLAIFGQTPAGIHVGLILINAVTTLLVFLLGEKLFGRLGGMVAAASYALLSTSPSVLGFQGHATHFVVVFAIAGILLLLKALESSKSLLFFSSGLLLGLAFLMKQPGVFFILFAVLYVARRRLIPPVNWKSLVVSTGTLIVGASLPFLLTCLLLLRAGVFRRFWFWTVSYGIQYGTREKLVDGFKLFQPMFADVVGPAAWIWMIAALGLTAVVWSGRARANAFFTISFLLFSFLAVCPGLYFRAHYFILMLPAVAILTGMAVTCAKEKLSGWHGTRILSATPVLLFLVAFSYSIFQQREFLFQMDPLEACDNLYGLTPFPAAIKIAKYVKSHSPEGSTIAVLGSEPEIYFYSHRRSATGYIYTYPLLEPQKYALDMQTEMIAEIERARPAFLVLVNVPNSWIAFTSIASPQGLLNWAQNYVHEHYVMDGVAELGNVTSFHWGDEARSYQPHSPFTIYVFKRTSP